MHSPREFPEPESPRHRELRPQDGGYLSRCVDHGREKLWTGRRDGHLVWPTFAYSRKGDRFALSMLRISHFIDLLDSLNDEDVKEQVI